MGLHRICLEFGRLQYVTVEEALKKIVEWYLDNEDWWLPFFSRSGVGQRMEPKS